MEHNNSFLTLAVAMVVTALVISAAILLLRQADHIVTVIADEEFNTTTRMMNAKYEEFNDTVVSGDKVIQAIKKYQHKITVTVKVGGSSKVFPTDTDKPSIDQGDEGYVDSTASFRSTLIKSANGYVTGLLFEKVGE